MPIVEKTVAVLFSGGDAPGMNAFLRAFVRLGLNRHGAAVLGIKDGYAGLVRTSLRLAEGKVTIEHLQLEVRANPGIAGIHRRGLDVVRMDHASVSGIIARGGIRLSTSRCEEFKRPETRRQVIELLGELEVSALVVVGGEGSLTGAALLAKESDLQIVGVPGTIDNDLPVTDLALGVDTAVTTIADAVRKFADTAASHHRIMVLETMGRRCGELARLSALASGAEIVVTPERPPLDAQKTRAIAERLERSLLHGRGHAIVLVSEGVKTDPPDTGGPAHTLATNLQNYFRREGSPFPGLEIRASILGHLQRGGSPTVTDRILAARFAETAWEEIASDKRRSGVLGLRKGEIVHHGFDNQANAERSPMMQKIYQLQKDISKL